LEQKSIIEPHGCWEKENPEKKENEERMGQEKKDKLPAPRPSRTPAGKLKKKGVIQKVDVEKPRTKKKTLRKKKKRGKGKERKKKNAGNDPNRAWRGS